jgi:NADH:ubiquinone oxidoreductase subunit E
MAMIVDVKEQDICTIVKAAVKEHGASREALLPILSQINREIGFIPKEAVSEIKTQFMASDEHVKLSEGQIFSIASFYHMLSTKKLGRHVVRFCESAPCHVMGGRELIQAINENLKLKPGETSSDNRWTLITTSCLGVCGVGPVLLVDDDIYGNVRPLQLTEIFAKYG